MNRNGGGGFRSIDRFDRGEEEMRVFAWLFKTYS